MRQILGEIFRPDIEKIICQWQDRKAWEQIMWEMAAVPTLEIFKNKLE